MKRQDRTGDAGSPGSGRGRGGGGGSGIVIMHGQCNFPGHLQPTVLAIHLYCHKKKGKKKSKGKV